MKKYTIDFFQDLAIIRKGKCLSSVYTNMKTKMDWQCIKKHKWAALPTSIVYLKTWCPKCRNEASSIRQLGNIEDLYLIAQDRKGKCLSSKYLGVRHKIEWQCQKGHKWHARPSDIKQGSWCPICSRASAAQEKIKYSLNDIKYLAIERGGLCLSTQYNKTCDKIKLRCQHGHEWVAIAKRFISGSWCKLCNNKNRRITIEEANRRLVSNKIKIQCLGVTHKNKKTRIKLNCSNNHIWICSLSSIRKKYGCPICSKRKKHTIEHMKKLALRNKGKCLSQQYKNNFTHLQWKCHNNHIWNAVPKNILKGLWCPTCSSMYGANEEKCRFIFKSLFKIDFPKTRKVISPLELDGYCEELKLAFEYNGEQHYWFISGFHKTLEKFNDQKKRDKRKKRLCKQKQINLIVIPYTKACSDARLISFICSKINILFPDFDFGKVCMKNFQHIPKQLQELKKIAIERGGKCISDVYINNKSHLTWKCKNDHTWTTNASTIKRGCWCPICAVNKKKKGLILINGN